MTGVEPARFKIRFWNSRKTFERENTHTHILGNVSYRILTKKMADFVTQKNIAGLNGLNQEPLAIVQMCDATHRPTTVLLFIFTQVQTTFLYGNLFLHFFSG